MPNLDEMQRWCGEARQLLRMAISAELRDNEHPLSSTVSGEAMTEALAQWTSVHRRVIGILHDLVREIGAAQLSESAQAVLELKAVIANLSAEPGTQQKVQELTAYVEADAVLAEVSELAQDIRTPLLAALSSVATQFEAR